MVGRARHLQSPRSETVAARSEPDGPVTANKTLGVHTAWGRTLKDVFQRYKRSAGSTSATRTASIASLD